MKRNILVIFLIIIVVIIAFMSAIFLINSFSVEQPENYLNISDSSFQSQVVDSTEETGDY